MIGVVRSCLEEAAEALLWVFGRMPDGLPRDRRRQRLHGRVGSGRHRVRAAEPLRHTGARHRLGSPGAWPSRSPSAELPALEVDVTPCVIEMTRGRRANAASTRSPGRTAGDGDETPDEWIRLRNEWQVGARFRRSPVSAGAIGECAGGGRCWTSPVPAPRPPGRPSNSFCDPGATRRSHAHPPALSSARQLLPTPHRTAYSPPMGKTILTILGVLLAIWLVFMVIGMIISALKFLIWVGFLAVIGAIIVTLVSKMAKSK
jgi:hypothetical protein